MQNSEPRESENDRTTRVKVEVRLRAVTEVINGSPVADVADDSVSVVKLSLRGASGTRPRDWTVS
ncbi:hypothetical protein CH282_14870 [Rhodococcus sp. 06-418-1B]|nr:hypothetical protein CH282_14870 [Rhodococcus sp. 06-418-1B]